MTHSLHVLSGPAISSATSPSTLFHLYQVQRMTEGILASLQAKLCLGKDVMLCQTLSFPESLHFSMSLSYHCYTVIQKEALNTSAIKLKKTIKLCILSKKQFCFFALQPYHVIILKEKLHPLSAF